MKKLVYGLAAAATLATALPAFAQGPRDWQPLNQRKDNIERRIDRGVDNGQLTRREARQLHRQYRDLLRMEAAFRRDGLDFRERRELERRYDALSREIRFQRHDSQDRFYPAGRR